MFLDISQCSGELCNKGIVTETKIQIHECLIFKFMLYLVLRQRKVLYIKKTNKQWLENSLQETKEKHNIDHKFLLQKTGSLCIRREFNFIQYNMNFPGTKV